MKKVRNPGCNKSVRYYNKKDYYSFHHEEALYNKTVEEVRVICPYCTRVLLIPSQKESTICPMCNRKVKNESRGRFKWMLRNYLK